MARVAPGGEDARPPTASNAAPSPGATRPTVAIRPLLDIRLLEVEGGFEPSHPYVRAFWVAAIGRGAVADLLRMIVAARRGQQLPRPLYLSELLRVGLAVAADGVICVPERIPPLPANLVRRLPPGLRWKHARVVRTDRAPGSG